jgi:hypothetical protein
LDWALPRQGNRLTTAPAMLNPRRRGDRMSRRHFLAASALCG